MMMIVGDEEGTVKIRSSMVMRRGSWVIEGLRESKGSREGVILW